MAKALYWKENGELCETIERCADGLILEQWMEKILETLSAAKTPKKDGKGSMYIEKISYYMSLLEAVQTAARKAFKETPMCWG